VLEMPLFVQMSFMFVDFLENKICGGFRCLFPYEGILEGEVLPTAP
jgi:hypothetical protein